MNQSKDPTKDNNHRRNIVNVNGTPVSKQQMVTGQMTVRTMNNNNYSSNSGRISRSQTPNFDDIPLFQNK